MDELEKKHVSDLKQTGSLEQLRRVRRSQVTEGPGAGCRLIDVKNAAGLQAVFNENHALDLHELSFRGVNIGFMSKNGLVNSRVLPIRQDYAATWPAGMLATCGLRNTGRDNEADGEYHPQHGAIGGCSAQEVSARLDESRRQIIVSGAMRESALFGPHLTLNRRITIAFDEAVIVWEDEVANLSAEPQAVFLLYHFNFGAPFLSPQLDALYPPGEVVPHDDEASRGLDQFARVSEPIDGKKEEVFFHHLLPQALNEDNMATVRLHNRRLKMRAQLSYDADALPVLTQWKSMKSGDYALGIEPGNSRLRGRCEELSKGEAFFLPGFHRQKYRLSLSLQQEGACSSSKS